MLQYGGGCIMSKLIKITHLTSVHTRYDTRIFLKMCSSLANNAHYQVNLVVADGKEDEILNNVHIIDVGEKIGGRLARMSKTVIKIFRKAKELDSDIYHFHDPELIPVGLKLKKIGKKVIFDSHEDIGKDILTKEWIPLFFRKMISIAYNIYERYACEKFDAIIAATPYIRDKFLSFNQQSIDINNFPILDELSNDTSWHEKKDEVCYVGGISQIRGIKEIVQAMEYTHQVRLNVVGTFSENNVEEEVKVYKGWQNVHELGFMTRNEVAKIMSRSKAGIVTFHPVPNHMDAQPNKMFEYMSAELPIISSNFPLWKEIVEGNACGICVNPLKPTEIAEAIEYIMSHPEHAHEMGQNGKKAVFNKYNWCVEEQKLFNVYERVKKP